MVVMRWHLIVMLLGLAAPFGAAALEQEPVLDGEALLAAARARVEAVDTATLQKKLREDPHLVLLDVRTEAEINYLGGTIPARFNHNVTRGWLEFRLPDLVPDRDTPIVTFCGTNIRSPLAASTLMDMGYTQVQFYDDGFSGWYAAGLAVETADKAPDSMLYSRPREVIPGVWSAIGATTPPTYQNSGHNNNLSFVISDDGVLVMNAGDNYLLAKALHAEIRKVTSQPVRYVVLENGQGHAMLGASYWREQGVPIIAHVDAIREIQQHGVEILQRMQAGRKDKALGTEVVIPDQGFEDKMVIEMGSLRIQLLHLGPAHSPGDILVWLPDRKLVIAGDMAFHERLLPVFEHTDTAGWIETWDGFEALGAEVVIPGHGGATSMPEVTRYTRDYLRYMREQVGALLASGSDLESAYRIDQTAYSHLDTFEELAKRNAAQIFRAMEFE